MFGRAAAVLLVLSIAVSNAVFGQCTYKPVNSFQFRSSYFDVAVDQYDFLAANGYGLALYGLTAGAPVLIATLPLPGTTRVIRPPYNGIVYAGSGTGVFSVAETSVPSGSDPGVVPIEGAHYGMVLLASVDTGATVNDLLPTASRLYVATLNGLQQYDISDPTRPTRTSVTLPTSGSAVTSIALDRNTLYVADSDSTIEVFSIADPANPQLTGTISSLPRVTSVNVDQSHLFASDGVQTDVFLLSTQPVTKIATLPFGVNTFTPISGDIAAVSGNDRRLRIDDFSLIAAPVELYATDLLPSGGTINRVNAIASRGNLYVAAGDIGLVVYDLGAFHAPYPLRSYATGATSSVVSDGDRFYAAGANGGLVEFKQASTGELTKLRQWDDRIDIAQDVAAGFLLTSSASTLTYWTLASTTPTAISTVSFSAPVKSAVVVGTTAYAVLDNQTIWTADLSQTTAAPHAVGTTAQHPTIVARSGSSIVIADVRDDGSSAIINYPTGDLLQTPRTATVPGAATALAHSGDLAAIFTFRGISVANLASNTVTTMSQSNGAIPTNLAIEGTNVLAATSGSLIVWDAPTGAVVRTIPLPSAPAWVDVPEISNGFAAVATADGITSVAYKTPSQLPSMLPLANANSYYRKVVAAKGRLYLFDGRGIDVFETAAGFTPHYLTRIAPAGLLDVTATDRGLFAVTNNGNVLAYGPDGSLIAQRNVIEGNADTTAMSIAAAAGVPWLSVSQGCLTDTCQRNTFVLDPSSLVRTATMSGAIIDVTTSGSRAYAITSLPYEVRVIDVGDALHPSTVVSRPTEGTSAPVSLAYSSGTVLVLGEKLYAYSEISLSKTGEQAVAFDPQTYVDQRIIVSGSCGVVTGRTAAPALYAVPSLVAGTPIPVPAAVRSLASSGANLYLLTDDSLEIWSTGTAPPAPRRRAVR